MHRFLLCFLMVLSSRLGAHVPPSSIHIIMTVDWEGDDLRPENIQAMIRIRQNFPDVPLLHYLNAAYFTKPQADSQAIQALIRQTMKPQDQFGIHIHGWKTLFEAAGVKHRIRPSWEAGGKPLTVQDCHRDCGNEIPISAYSYDELRKVLATSKSILQKQGFSGLQHFRAGGWVTSPALIEALAAEGFKTDSSAVPVPLIADEIVGMDLLGLLRSYWKDITTKSQPYKTQGALWQVPDNASLADYMPAEEALKIVSSALKDLKPGTTHYIIAGFHQETAEDWESRVTDFLKGVEKLRQQQKAPIIFTSMPESF